RPPLRAYYADLTSSLEFRILTMRIFRIFLSFILCAISACVNAVHKILSNIFAYTRRCPMTFGEKLRRARKEKGLTQAELANQAGLGLRTIIAYEKGETYPQKRSTYQTLADILGVQADDLHNEESTTNTPPLSRTQWENSKQRYEKLLPDGPTWPGAPTYEAYCEKMARSAGV